MGDGAEQFHFSEYGVRGWDDVAADEANEVIDAAYAAAQAESLSVLRELVEAIEDGCFTLDGTRFSRDELTRNYKVFEVACALLTDREDSSDGNT